MSYVVDGSYYIRTSGRMFRACCMEHDGTWIVMSGVLFVHDRGVMRVEQTSTTTSKEAAERWVDAVGIPDGDISLTIEHIGGE